MPRARDKFERSFFELNENARNVLGIVERLPHLLQVEERLAATMALMRAWIWETDLQHRLTYLSESAGAETGFASVDMLGRTPEDLGVSVPDPGDKERLCRLLKSRAAFGPVDHLWRAPAGDLRLRVLGMPRADRSGDFAGYRGIALQSERVSSPMRPEEALEAS